MNCDAIAPWYRTLEYAVFGHALERGRCHYLAELGGARRALLIGDGDGRFLQQLLVAFPRISVDCVDVSEGMLAQARARVGEKRVRYVRLDALRDPWPADDYDLVVTHFVFDCFDAGDQRALAMRAPKARWLLTEFRSAGALSAMLIGIMYRFFGLATGLRTRALSDHHPALESAGYRLEKSAEHRGGLLVSELWSPGPVK